MQLKRPRVRYLVLTISMVALYVALILVEPAFTNRTMSGTSLMVWSVCLVMAIVIYRFDRKRYSVHQAVPPPEEEPTA
ncbi:hypothetical protein [Nocardiopsis eucommiae]|uniref:hypothetical protein n=1 Tax=Nocardiopsis eucommiae TaxID=2831970 RepID=UPI003D76267C